MSILASLRAAIAPAAAARAGYLQGEAQETDKLRAERLQDAALQRQGALDQLRAILDASTINRNNAEAERAIRVAPTKPTAMPTLRDINVFDPTTNTLADVYSDGSRQNVRKATPQQIAKFNHVPSDPDAPKAPKPPTLSERLAAARAGVTLAEQGLPHPSKIQYIPNPAYETAPVAKKADMPSKILNPAYPAALRDSASYDATVLQPARKTLMELIRAQTDGGTSQPPPPQAEDPATAMYAKAADAYKASLAAGADPTEASHRYNAIVEAIAKKFGQVP